MIRDLTAEERATLERRKAGFNEFFGESMPVLADFMRRLGLADPWRVVNEPELFLSSVAEWSDRQEVSNDDRDWIATRLGYFIGYVLTQRLGGHWMVVEDPDSPLFIKYVVGGFARVRNRRAVTDPFGMAIDYLDREPPRDLVSVIGETEVNLQQL